MDEVFYGFDVPTNRSQVDSCVSIFVATMSRAYVNIIERNKEAKTVRATHSARAAARKGRRHQRGDADTQTHDETRTNVETRDTHININVGYSESAAATSTYSFATYSICGFGSLQFGSSRLLQSAVERRVGSVARRVECAMLLATARRI